MIYSTGYTGKSIVDLAPMLSRLNAVLIDIRYSPASWVPQWRFQELQALLGESYYWVRYLGNRNYKSGGDIEIDNLDAGLRELGRIMTATQKSAILLCGCEKYRSCHRKVVAEAIVRLRDLKVSEILDWKESGNANREIAWLQQEFL